MKMASTPTENKPFTARYGAAPIFMLGGAPRAHEVLAVKEHRLDLEKFTELEGDALLEQLHALRGVGRWSAEYVSLRGLGRLQVFPGDDVGAQNKLQRYLGLRKPPSYDTVRRRLAQWGDYAGLIYFHLLLHGLAEKGCLS